jgi:hypothetical protein
MVDPTMVVEKIVVHDEPLPYSFFGPPAKPAYAQEASASSANSAADSRSGKVDNVRKQPPDLQSAAIR